MEPPGEGVDDAGAVVAKVRHLRVTEDYAGQRVDNFLIRELKGCPRRMFIASSVPARYGLTAVACVPKPNWAPAMRWLPPVRVAESAMVPTAPASSRIPCCGRISTCWRSTNQPGWPCMAVPASALVLSSNCVWRGGKRHCSNWCTGSTATPSGVLLIAKTRAGLLVGMHDTLREKSGDKRYLAAVKGEWVNDRQHVKAPLAKYTRPDGERRVEVNADEGQFAQQFSTCWSGGRDESALKRS